MTLARKSTRQIIVEGIKYRWLVSPNERELAIVVEQAESPRQKMTTGVEYGNIISPWLVRKAILQALSRGWQPHKQGSGIGFGFEGIVNRKNESEATFLMRRYHEEDWESVWNLYELIDSVKMHRGNGACDKERQQISTIYLASGGDFAVGVLQNQIVAMGALKPRSKTSVEIKQMRVHPDFQRRGYGQQLLEYLEGQAIKLGQKIHLHTTSIQIPAQRL